MKKKWSALPAEARKIILVIATLVVVVSFWWWWRRLVPASTTTLSGYLLGLPDYSYVGAQIKNHRFTLEVVNSSTSIQQGLSDREEIGTDGMLFVMPARGYYSFWMPRMHFDLDIVWLDEGEIVDITANVPAEPGVPTSQLSLYTSARPANLVLEIPAGRAALLDLRVGDQLVIDR